MSFVQVRLLSVIVITALGFLSYIRAFDSSKEFTNWDDQSYVTKQEGITSVSADSLLAWFDTDKIVASNYHPITMISLAANYAMSGTNMSSYIATNVGLHIANSLLVFWLFILLFPERRLVPLFAGLWFCIHPMHVESVAWISERKDVLYGFFFLISAITYYRYKQTNSITMLAASFAAFVASCLSKAMAVPLPLVLLAADYYHSGRISKRDIASKIPFFIVSLIIGLITVSAQSGAGAIADKQYYSFVNNTLFAFRGLLTYMAKLFVPTNLSAFYPIPWSTSDPMDAWYKMGPVLVALVALALFLVQRKRPEFRRVFVLGSVLFVSMLVLVLQFVSVGSAVLAERYTYLPYIGLFVILFGSLDLVRENLQRVLWGVLGAVSLWFVLLTVQQVGVWKNSGTLWTQVIDKHIPVSKRSAEFAASINPYVARTALVNRALYYRNNRQVDLAITDLALARDVGLFHGPVFELRAINYVLLGELYDNANQPKQAFGMLKEGIMRFLSADQSGSASNEVTDRTEFLAYCRTFIDIGMKLRASNDILEVVNLVTLQIGQDPVLLAARGGVYGMQGKHDKAIEDLRASLALDPSKGFVRDNLALAFELTNQPDSARKYRNVQRK